MRILILFLSLLIFIPDIAYSAGGFCKEYKNLRRYMSSLRKMPKKELASWGKNRSEAAYDMFIDAQKIGAGTSKSSKSTAALRMMDRMGIPTRWMREKLGRSIGATARRIRADRNSTDLASSASKPKPKDKPKPTTKPTRPPEVSSLRKAKKYFSIERIAEGTGKMSVKFQLTKEMGEALYRTSIDDLGKFTAVMKNPRIVPGQGNGLQSLRGHSPLWEIRVNRSQPRLFGCLKNGSIVFSHFEPTHFVRESQYADLNRRLCK